MLLIMLPESRSIVLTLLTEAIFKSNDCEQSTFRRSPPPSDDFQGQNEMISINSLEGTNNTARLHGMASSSQPLQDTAHPSGRLCRRIQYLCKQDFRTEPWYLDNLRLLASVSIAVMPVIIPFGTLHDHGGLTMILLVSVPAAFGLVASTVIPVCGIVAGIRHRPMSRRSSLFIGLAIDPKYQTSRWIFFSVLGRCGWTCFQSCIIRSWVCVYDSCGDYGLYGACTPCGPGFLRGIFLRHCVGPFLYLLAGPGIE